MTSQRAGTIDDVLRDPPLPHRNPMNGEACVMGLTDGALRFIASHVTPSSATLETGCGLSTVVFALTGAQHWTITPSRDEFRVVVEYCRARGIATERVTHVAAGSETALPGLDLPSLDLVLIDGRHGFPAPYIDWYYTAPRLRRGGYVIVDDTWLWSCQILRDFLMQQVQWQFIKEVDGRTAIFQKREDGAESAEWNDQPLVARSGRLRWANGQMYDTAVPPPRPRPLWRRVAGRVARKLGLR